MKHTRGRFVGNVIASIGGWPGSASGIWNRNDAAAATRGSTWPVYSSVPDAPTITAVARVSGSGTSIDVTFTAPANNGGQPITSYTAVSTPGNVTASISQAGSGTIRVTGLSQGTSYTFVVYATNVVGNSANSTASSAIVAATVPGTPTIGTPTRVSGSGTEIDVPFSAPASDGGLPITTYWITYQYSGGGGGQSISQAGSGTKRVTGLTQGTSYTFRVYATNAVGDSPSSAASEAIIPATLPGTPTIGTATATAPFTATVSYTAPASNGGLAITSYTAVSSPGGITGTLSQPGSGTITVSGLSGGTSYTFVVYATNGIGNSPNSASSNQITIAISRPLVDYLVVGGGGGGGGDDGGGGGAGGVLVGSGYQIVAGTYMITVGNGGAGRYNSNGADGSSSSFGPFTAAGGGGGAYRSPGTGNAGGSGGGASGGGGQPSNRAGGAGNTPATTPSQGNAGGTALATVQGSAGGGGASQAGFNNSGTPSNGKGGDGIASSISGTSTYYGGGGGGGAVAGAGGNGGGGAGSAGWQGPAGTSGTIYTGGGGGGACNSTGSPGGSGGKGVVILRWLNTYPQPTSTTGSPTVVNSGGYWIYTWTGDGSLTFS